MFHCAGSDPATGSEHAESAQYTIIATDRSALVSPNGRNRFIFRFSCRAPITILVKENAYLLDANNQSFGFIFSILVCSADNRNRNRISQSHWRDRRAEGR